MILVFAQLAIVGPILSKRAFVSEIFNEIRHFELNGYRHLLHAFECPLFYDDFVHDSIVIK